MASYASAENGLHSFVWLDDIITKPWATNKAVAIRKAHEIAQRIARSEERPVKSRIDLVELVKQYLSVQTDRGVAPKTLVKYYASTGRIS